MAETIQEVLTKVVLVGALAAFLAYLILRFGLCTARFVDSAFRHYIALPFLGKVLLPVFFGIAFVYGSTKTNGVMLPRLAPRPLTTVTDADIAHGWQIWEVRTNETDFTMPANAVRRVCHTWLDVAWCKRVPTARHGSC